MPETALNTVHTEGKCAHRGQLSLDDPGIHEVASLPLELMLSIKDKRFRHWKSYFVTPSVVIYREFYSTKLSVIGLSPPDMLRLSIPLKLGCNTTDWNQPLKTGSLPITMPGEVGGFIDAGQSSIFILINLQLLHQHCSEERIEKLEMFSQQHFMPSTTEKIIQLSNWLCQRLDETLVTDADVCGPYFSNSFISNKAAVQSFEQELLHRLGKFIDASCAEKKRPPVSLRQRGLKKALDYLYSSDNVQLSILNLCKQAEVSQRTLEYAFQQTFNLSPVAFIRKIHLHSFPSPYLSDEEGKLRIFAGPVTFSGLINVAFDQIRQYGRSSVAVTIRLLETLTTIAAQTRHAEQQQAILRQARMIKRASHESIPEKNDRDDVQQCLVRGFNSYGYCFRTTI